MKYDIKELRNVAIEKLHEVEGYYTRLSTRISDGDALPEDMLSLIFYDYEIQAYKRIINAIDNSKDSSEGYLEFVLMDVVNKDIKELVSHHANNVPQRAPSDMARIREQAYFHGKAKSLRLVEMNELKNLTK